MHVFQAVRLRVWVVPDARDRARKQVDARRRQLESPSGRQAAIRTSQLRARSGRSTTKPVPHHQAIHLLLLRDHLNTEPDVNPRPDTVTGIVALAIANAPHNEFLSVGRPLENPAVVAVETALQLNDANP